MNPAAREYPSGHSLVYPQSIRLTLLVRGQKLPIFWIRLHDANLALRLQDRLRFVAQTSKFAVVSAADL